MNISIIERIGKSIEGMLSPDDHIVLRCTSCQEFFLPRELHILKRRVLLGGQWTFDIKELCPACFPNPEAHRKEEAPPESSFIRLSREEFDLTRSYERAGLLPPAPIVVAN